MDNLYDKIYGALFGAALGDAFGRPTEFMNYREIERFSPESFVNVYRFPLLKVTDDTQMSIAVADALMDAYAVDKAILPLTFEKQLRKHFVSWLHDPQNNRAPGMTCLGACENLARGVAWEMATRKNSKGCGANMRVLPAGLMKFKKGTAFTDKDVAKWAQFQSAMTHAHPTALAAAELTAMALVKLIEGIDPESLLSFLLEYGETQMQVYHEDFLQTVWERPMMESPTEFIQMGWQENLAALRKVETAYLQYDGESDPCVWTGAGWIAEEALATGLFCFLLYPDNFPKVIERAVRTSGDSDSIACLAGGFAGAYLGVDAIPVEWLDNLEYRDDLEAFGEFLEAS